MSKIKRLRKNFMIVIVFNVFLLLIGVGLSLLLPKYLPKEEYGIYRLLTFYITYCRVLQLGYIDGIYLFYGGKNIFELDKKDNSKVFSTFVAFQVVIGIILMLVLSIGLQNSINRDVYLLIGLDMILMNVIYFYHHISQLNEKFTLYSVMFILTKLVVLIALIPLTRSGFTTGITFIWINIFVNLFIIVFYYLRYVKHIEFRFKLVNKQSFDQMMKIGFPIFMAGLIAMIIMGIDRFVVDAFFTNIEFAEYSFAVSLIGMFIIFITAITRLTFPYIKLLKPENVLDSKYVLGVVLVILFALTISGYYPLVYVVKILLPDYVPSLGLVFVLLPLLIFKAEIDISISNVYKAKLLRRKYFQVNLISFVAAIVVFVVALQVNRSLLSIAIASTISYGLWYFISDLYLHIKLSKGGYDKYILLVLVLVGYFFIGYSDLSDLLKFVSYFSYALVLSIVYVIIDFKKIKSTVKLVREDLKN